MMIMRFSVVISLLVLAVTPCLEGSLLPFLDRSSSNSLGEVWQDRFPDPFRVLEQIPFGFEKGDMAVSLGSVDWKETPDAHVIMLDVPGFKKEDLKIEVEENRILRVSGEREKEEEKKGDHWHREERSYGKFWRQFRLPDNVDLDSVKAKLENGVLTICFKKLSPDQIKGPKVVSIAAEEMKEKLMEGGSAKQEL